jgi:hypothetical protein
VPQGMRSDIAVELRLLNGALKVRLHGFDGLPVPLDEMGLRNAFLLRAPEVREKSRRNGNRWLALVRLAPTFRKPIVDPAFEINEGTSDASMREAAAIEAARVPVYRPSRMKRARWRRGRFSVSIFSPLRGPR